MFEILVYLVENYFHSGNYPDSETLSRRLSAAGFEDEEISAALDWLDGLESSGQSNACERFAHSAGLRVYTEQELAKTTAETRGFLLFLQNAGILNAPQRELIIERIAALDEPGIPLERVKLIVLLVLWNQRQPLDPLLVEELLAAAEERRPH
jgi:Smg protein